MKRLLLLLILAPSFAFAWGETGHRVVCQIAYDELLPDARVELDRLLALDSDFDNFADSCLFADKPERIRWQDHFINLPRSSQAVTTSDCPMAETCAFSAIHSDFLVLLDPQATDTEKLLALKLLGHWVGDVHQPMHVSFQDDRGANSNHVDPHDEDASLHGVWDYAIIAHNYGDDYRLIAADLGGAISAQQRKAWQHDSPIEWVNESFQITISPAAAYCVQKQGTCWYSNENMVLDTGEEWRNLSIAEDYLQLHAPTIELRLQQAAIRLAKLLNQSLTNGINNE
jgi:hypothetical protein